MVAIAMTIIAVVLVFLSVFMVLKRRLRSRRQQQFEPEIRIENVEAMFHNIQEEIKEKRAANQIPKQPEMDSPKEVHRVNSDPTFRKVQGLNPDLTFKMKASSVKAIEQRAPRPVTKHTSSELYASEGKTSRNMDYAEEHAIGEPGAYGPEEELPSYQDVV